MRFSALVEAEAVAEQAFDSDGKGSDCRQPILSNLTTAAAPGSGASG